ncbi:MAG: transcriptional repressor [Planctomycetales bacterium]
MSKRKSNPSLEEIRERLRAANLRCTTARIAVLRRMTAEDHPVTHAELADELAPEGFDRTTIYRNLVELSEAGLLSRIALGDHLWRFELRDENAASEDAHPHFLCLDCGEVSCLPDASVSVDAGSSPAIGDVTEVLLKGHCERCR